MESKYYWKGIEELKQDAAYVAERDKEFVDELPVDEIFSASPFTQPTPRRDFLKMLGFGISAATLASCRIPVKKAIPYVIKPEEVIPGVANYYASTYIDGSDFCPVLVKVRDGRPIKVEPMTSRHIAEDSPNRFFFGGTSARAQASILSLYDLARPRNWTESNTRINKLDQNKVDINIKSQLRDSKGSIRILSSTIISPSTQQAINDFITAYPSAKHIVYEPVSYEGMLIANEKFLGKRTIPGYHFEKAKVIVSIGADFLGTWISPTEYTRQYVQNRKVSPENTKMSRHYQFESRLSLTGSNADYRGVIKPSEMGLAVLSLYNKLAEKKGMKTFDAAKLSNEKANTLIEKAANDLLAAGLTSTLVVCGSNDANVQLLVNQINLMLANFGGSINTNRVSSACKGSDKAMTELWNEMNSSLVGALIVYGSNPVYDHPNGKAFGEEMKKIGLTISLNANADETTEQCKYHIPDNHFLESWNDASPRTGLFTMVQPAISPLFETRQAQESFLKWSGNTDDYYTYIKKNWERNSFPNQSQYSDFMTFWDYCVKEGALEISVEESTVSVTLDEAAIAAATSAVINNSASKGLELEVYEKVAIGNGRNSNNPWLMEMPDPISRVVWDNYVAVSPKFASENGLEYVASDRSVHLVTVKAGNISVDVPAFIQPGQNDHAVALALGFGRRSSRPVLDAVGANAFVFVSSNGETARYFNNDITITKTGRMYDLAMTQTHFSYEGRDAIKDTSLGEYQKNPNEGIEEKEKLKEIWAETLYPTQSFPGPRWAMSIDLNSCIGCGACTVSCMAENNVPVVGKEEVKRVHEMTWLRIDRYFSFPEGSDRLTKETDIQPDNLSETKVKDFQEVQVSFQPMLCQHCINAPCENVCPVNATNHSSEGLNQMAYNRCIGTRYCANNCPYKVRRFNWLDYTTADVFPWNEPWKIPTLHSKDLGYADPLTRMVLNPDVTVRSRGVMEKCSFCVQRIQEVKLTAKKESRPVMGNEVKTACQTACPADAIVFGNINDEESAVAKHHEDARAYYVLADLNTRPSIAYMKKVRNVDEVLGKEHQQDKHEEKKEEVHQG